MDAFDIILKNFTVLLVKIPCISSQNSSPPVSSFLSIQTLYPAFSRREASHIAISLSSGVAWLIKIVSL